MKAFRCMGVHGRAAQDQEEGGVDVDDADATIELPPLARGDTIQIKDADGIWQDAVVIKVDGDAFAARSFEDGAGDLFRRSECGRTWRYHAGGDGS